MTKFSFEDQLRAVNMYLRGYGSNTVAFGTYRKEFKTLTDQIDVYEISVPTTYSITGNSEFITELKLSPLPWLAFTWYDQLRKERKTMAANFKNYIIRGTEMFSYLFILDFIIEMILIKGNGKITTVLGLHVKSFITLDEQELTLYLSEYSLIPYLLFLFFWTKFFKWRQQRTIRSLHN